MNNEHDQSYLDKRYFVDAYKYNCPYCNRHSVTYSVIDKFTFNWSNDKKVYAYLVRCGGDSCNKTSMHLSNLDIERIKLNSGITKFYKIISYKPNVDDWYIDDFLENKENLLDNLFFYHQPTTFFTLDNRVNKKIRVLVSEAEGCAKMNYLIGASACIRKAIYELLKLEKISEKVNNQEGKSILLSYEDRIKVLKNKYNNIEVEYFDALSNIQNMASKQLHEGDWEPWDNDKFVFIEGVLKEILTEMYIRPKEKKNILEKILELKPREEIKKEVEEKK